MVRQKRWLLLAVVLLILALTTVFLLHNRTGPQDAAIVKPSSQGAPASPVYVEPTTPQPEDITDEMLAELTEEAERALPRPNDEDVYHSDFNSPRRRAHRKLVTETADSCKQRRIDVFLELTPYHVAEKELKESILSEYGQITRESVPTLVADAERLEEQFWGEGDFNNTESFKHIYRARALLELCVEATDENEATLKQLVEVIHSGWPYFHYEGEDPTPAFENLQRAYDLYVPLRRLWREHLSKRSAATFQDMCYAYDMTTYTWLEDEDWIDGRQPERYSAEFAKLNPEPASELKRLFEEGMPVEERLAIARWAADGAKAKGGYRSIYEISFRKFIAQRQAGETGAPRGRFTQDVPDNYDSLGEYYRYSLGRGASFAGPQWRGPRLKPMHVLMEENDRALERYYKDGGR